MKLMASLFVTPLFLSTMLFTQAREICRDERYTHHYESHNGYRSGLSFTAGAIFGGIVATAPRPHTTVIIRDTPSNCSQRVYYRPSSRGYVISAPPSPIILNECPNDASQVWISGRPYYFSQGVYYVQESSGYRVVSQPTEIVTTSVVSYPSSSTASLPAPAPVSNSFYKKGRDWGMDLRNEVATMDEFINYLKSDVPNSSSPEYQEFRSGFISSYGLHAETAIDKAYKKAKP